MIFVFLVLISLSMIISRSVHVAVNVSPFYLINSLQLNFFKCVPRLHIENHNHILQLNSHCKTLHSYAATSVFLQSLTIILGIWLAPRFGAQTPLWAHHFGSMGKPQFPHLQNVDNIAVSTAG